MKFVLRYISLLTALAVFLQEPVYGTGLSIKNCLRVPSGDNAKERLKDLYNTITAGSNGVKITLPMLFGEYHEMPFQTQCDLLKDGTDKLVDLLKIYPDGIPPKFYSYYRRTIRELINSTQPREDDPYRIEDRLLYKEMFDCLRKLGVGIVSSNDGKLMSLFVREITNMNFEQPLSSYISDGIDITELVNWQRVQLDMLLSIIAKAPEAPQVKHLITYIIIGIKVKGMYSYKSEPVNMFLIEEIISNIKYENNYYLIRLMSMMLMDKFDSRIGTDVNDELRKRTRQAEHSIGLAGWIRTDIHTHISHNSFYLMEKTLKFYTTGDKEILRGVVPDEIIEHVLNSDADKSKHVSIYTSKEFVQKAKSQMQIFLIRLGRRVGKQTADVEDILDIKEEELEHILPDNDLLKDYIWVYRQLALRFNFNLNIDTALGKIANLTRLHSNWSRHLFDTPLTIEEDGIKRSTGMNVNDSPLFRALRSNDDIEALRQACFLRNRIKKRLFSDNQYVEFDLEETSISEGNRDFQGVLGDDNEIQLTDERLNLYELDFYISRIEDIIIPNIVNIRLKEIDRDNLPEAIEVIDILFHNLFYTGLGSRELIDILQDDKLNVGQVENFLNNTVPWQFKLALLQLKEDLGDNLLKYVNRWGISSDKSVMGLAMADDTKESVLARLPAHMVRNLVFTQVSFKLAGVLTTRISDFCAVLKKSSGRAGDSSFKISGFSHAEQLPQEGFLFGDSLDIEKVEKISVKQIGQKGKNILRMIALGIPVPPGIIYPIDMATDDILTDINSDIKRLEALISQNSLNDDFGSIFGDPDNPIIVSVRSGARFTMPGQLVTMIDVGINQEIVEKGLTKRFGAWCAWDSYRRFLESWGIEVLGMDRAIFRDIMDAKKNRYNVSYKKDFSGDQMKELALDYKSVVDIAGKRKGILLPDSPLEQLKTAINVVRSSWNKPEAVSSRELFGLSQEKDTALFIQAMTFGNVLDEDSFSGALVLATDKTYHADIYPTGQGKDLADAVVLPYGLAKLQRESPEVHEELMNLAKQVTNYMGNSQKMEITIQRGKLWFLQTTNNSEPLKGKKFSKISEQEAVKQGRLLAKGYGAGILGCFRGAIVLPETLLYSTDDEIRELEKKAKEKGADGLVLVMDAAWPEDTRFINKTGAFIANEGGKGSHTADMAILMSKVAVMGIGTIKKFSPPVKGEGYITIGDKFFSEGEIISVNGITGDIYRGIIELESASTNGKVNLYKIPRNGITSSL